jgi:O-antigen/teichoic acid export membrane protein
MQDNKLIFKNTIFLYVRMIVTMLVSLYTSRVILNLLGVEDFGIYTLVAGFVSLLGFLNSSLSNASQRFLSFELGKNTNPELNKIFRMSINIHIILTLIIIIISETFGIWIVNYKLSIPTERIIAANWVFQFSVLTFIISVIQVPYNALIIAKEEMQAFAWISILDVIMKLTLVLTLSLFNTDKLALYSILLFIVGLMILIVNIVYCKVKFPVIRYALFWEKKLFFKMFNFTSWNIISDLAYAFYAQGLSILLGIFFGPMINASTGIAYQVMGAINSFVRNFQTAINPQIIKSFSSSNNFLNVKEFIFSSSRFSFFLLSFFVLPFLIEGEFILTIWLGILPPKALIFTKLVLVIILVESLTGSLNAAAQGKGDIKLYQTISGLLMLSILPISYVLLKFKFSAESVFWVGVFVSLLCLIFKMVILNNLIKFPIFGFIKEVLAVGLFSILLASVIPVFVKSIILKSFSSSVLIILITLICNIVSTFFVGLNKNEKLFLGNFIRNKIKAVRKIQ